MESKQQKLKLYAVGSAEISQFSIPLPQGKKQKPSNARKPLCLSTIEQFDLIEDPDAEQIVVKRIPNILLKQSIIKVACGGVHTLLLTETKKVYSFGSNDQGALGRKGEETVPALIDLKLPVDMITAGDCHSLFVNFQEDILYFCGVYRGIVKGHIAEKVQIPQQIQISDLSHNKKLKKIKKIVSGFNHSMVLVDDTILIRGDLEYFALGRKILQRHKDRIKSTDWLAIGLKKVQDIWTGGMHCFASVKKGKNLEYYAWGNNAFGQLGLGHKGQVFIPQKIHQFEDMNIVKIVGGQHHTIILTSEGQVYSCGKNDYGQLGLGEDFEQSEIQEQSQQEKAARVEISCSLKPRKVEIEDVTDIIAGPHFSYAITNKGEDNQLYSWGFSASYVLINGSQDNDKAQPYNVLKKILNYEKIVELSAGGQHIMYLAEPNPNPPVQPVAVNVHVAAPIAPPVPVFIPYSSQALNTLSTNISQTQQSDSNPASQPITGQAINLVLTGPSSTATPVVTQHQPQTQSTRSTKKSNINSTV